MMLRSAGWLTESVWATTPRRSNPPFPSETIFPKRSCRTLRPMSFNARKQYAITRLLSGFDVGLGRGSRFDRCSRKVASRLVGFTMVLSCSIVNPGKIRHVVVAPGAEEAGCLLRHVPMREPFPTPGANRRRFNALGAE